MNAHSTTPVEMTHEDVLRVQLQMLRREHRDLDEAIGAMAARGMGDQLALVRLKKQKLGLKDRIARIEDQLTPDIIA
ncbi:YdcH family protein [Paracoccus sp. p4-l81]|uniref:YdcH family protein n=1 Tax=unclassified Paracoccus (in: a-proteobacteria) TaxID=2688777 RepID=UPI0035BA3A88